MGLLFLDQHSVGTRIRAAKVDNVTLAEVQQAIDEFVARVVLAYASHEDLLATIQVQPAYFRRLFKFTEQQMLPLVKAHAVYRTICANPIADGESDDFMERLRGGGSFNNKTKCRVPGKINSVYFWDGGGGHPSSCEPLKSKSMPDWLKGVWPPTFIQSGNDNGAHASRVPVPTFVYSELGNGRTQWRHCVPIPQNTMSTSESGTGSARPSAYHVMEKDLKPLYDLSGAEGAENLDAVKEYFTRYRQIRGKRTNNAYTQDALLRSWYAFIRRWNAAGREGLSFASWLEDREATRSTRAIGDLRVRVCEMAE
ncbi:unnamed protein product [Phytophthora fragariaefolia]|uniref:Unnamed protein product n=1 Tax=Phytophthora fragariaefolia TaxID=1490495 RepID=A0A9W7CQ72_9STRA|nr:unnamed protein product [Phytophthora fragariaefolia]